jgi:hypothetical protein
MSKLRLVLVLGGLLLSASMPTWADEPTDAEPTLTEEDAAPSPQCEIRLLKQGSILRVETFVMGAPGSSGVYDFTLMQAGSSGASEVSQSGAYAIESDGQATLTINEFSHSRHDQLDALLSLDTPEGRVECHKGS